MEDRWRISSNIPQCIICFILIILCVMDQTRALQILGKSYSQLLISLSVCMSLSPSLPLPSLLFPSLLPTPELGIAHLSLLPLEFYAYLKPYSLVSGNRFKIPMNLPLTLKNLSFFEIVLTSLWVLWDLWRYFFANISISMSKTYVYILVRSHFWGIVKNRIWYKSQYT